jgi:hypothetical protein
MIKLELIMLSEISQTQKDKYHISSHMWNLHLKNGMNIKGGLLGRRN